MQESEKPQKKPRKIKPDGADGHRQRMFTKFLNTVDRDIYPRDVIEMLLYFSIPVRDTRDSAVHLMERFDGDVQALLNADPQLLCEIDGVGQSSAMLLNLVGRIANRIPLEDSDERPRLLTTEAIGGYFMERFSNTKEDELWVAFFDNSMRPISTKLKGEPIGMYAEDIYELFRLSAIHHCSMFVLARMDSEHCVHPTIVDTMVFEFIEASLGGSDLKMIDYLIITADEMFSLRKPPRLQ